MRFAGERDAVMRSAAGAPREFYDNRFQLGYQGAILESGYDACVLAALRWALRSDLALAGAVLDYGCGQGRYLPVLTEMLPQADVIGADISPVALELARARCPAAPLMLAESLGLPGVSPSSFDLIVMVDVIEHVADAEATVSEIHRLLRPGGRAVITTPCANPGSIGWLYSRIAGGFEPTPDGISRFVTDEPGHLRRLSSARARDLLGAEGLDVERIRWWGHLIVPLMDRLERLPRAARRQLGLLDWRLFRRLPNGGAMILVVHKPGSEGRTARGGDVGGRPT